MRRRLHLNCVLEENSAGQKLGWSSPGTDNSPGSSVLRNPADGQLKFRWGWGARGDEPGEMGRALWRVALTTSRVYATIS